jgi:hypothetical protein
MHEGQPLEERSGKDLMENGLAFTGLLEEDLQVLRFINLV